jgi:2,4-dienoyl-CoA reductase-like NADH-dependent reductase (Old Yellow Enzyme family)/thioredoxin reductase
MAHPYEELFKPISIRGMHLDNRIVMPPMHTKYASESGEATERIIEYLVERSKGGVGLIILENTCVDWEVGRAAGNPITIHDDLYRTCLSDLVLAVHRGGAKIVTQLHHAGRQNLRSDTVGNQQPVAPSPVQSEVGGDMPKEMNEEDIEKAIQQYVDGARRTKECGFDGVQLHGAHGYLLTEFLSPHTNRRTDKWGGSFENRCRFPVEVVRRVRAEIGPNYPLLYRYSAEERRPEGGGIELEEGVKFAKVLENEGVDCMDVSAGIYESMPWIFTMQGTPVGSLVSLAAAVKAEVDIPVIAVSSLGWDPAVANEVIKSGQADMVQMGRSLLADPEIPNKTREGRPHEIRRCIRCNDCVGSLFKGWRLYCIINPELGYEYKKLVQPAAKPKKIAVLGAGPSSLEYAVTAARRGHQVTILEQGDKIGGQLNLAGVPAYKREEIGSIVSYYEAMLKKWGVEVRLGVTGSAETIAGLNPELVVIAVGSNPMDLRVPGGEGAKPATNVLMTDAGGLGENVAIIGGNGVGLDTAMFLKEKGKKVTVVEQLDDIGTELSFPLQWQLKDLLEARDIEVLTEHEVVGISGHTVEMKANGTTKKMTFDDVVSAVGFVSADTSDLERSLVDAGYEVKRIGSCVKPGHIYDAVHGGFWAALEA